MTNIAEEFMEFIVDGVAITGAGPGGGYSAVAEAEINMPVSENENLAVCIHHVDFYPSTLVPEDASQNELEGGLSRRSGFQTTTRDLIAQYAVIYTNGQAQGTLTEYAHMVERGSRLWDFAPPILIAQRTLYFFARNFNNVTQTMNVRIGYTIRKVSKDVFIAALVSY